MKAKDVPSYIAAEPKERQAMLRRLRGVIRKALPRAEEFISYQIPMYRVDGKMVIFFAGWAKHYSLYPVGSAITSNLDAKGYKAAKGTIRFRYDEPMPVKLIEKIVKLRLKESKLGIGPGSKKKKRVAKSR